MKFIAQYSLKENLRRKCYFVICFLTCFLVSLICLVAKTIVSQGALIFLMLAEKDSGEIDFVITPLTKTRNASSSQIDDLHKDNAFINFTKYEEIMKDSQDSDSETANPFDTSAIRIYYDGYSPSYELYLMLIDTDKERDMELGRSYPFEKLKEGQCLVHKNLINGEKNKFNITINMKTFLMNTLLYYYNDIKDISDPGLEHLKNLPYQVNFECDIVDIFDDNFGKESGDDDNIVIMELEYFYKFIYKFIPIEIKELFPDYPDIIKNIKPQDYGNILIINFPKNRLNYYTEDDYDNLLDKGVKYMNEIVQKIGSFHSYSSKMPLIRTMQKFKTGTTMLNLILNLILIGIFGLSLILIYSLLLIITETNSFEFGILRLIGNSKFNIIFLIIFQCLCFSLPAFIVALGLSFLFLSLINNIIQSELDTNLGISITFSSFIYSFLLNFLAPIIAAILPIRNILKKNIATSINTTMNKTQGVKIEVVSLQKQELISLIIFGLITFIYGASIYYFLPLSLVSLNMGLIGAIFLWILFGILLGFILLSQNIENLLNKLLTYTLLFFTKSYTKLLILKNLAAHKIKNKKTSLMFSLSIGIFIMISVGFDLILQSTKNMNIQIKGSEILIMADKEYITPDEISDALMELYNEDLIEDFAIYTARLNDICLNSKPYVINYGKTVSSKQYVLGVNSAYFSATSNIDLKISEQNENFQDYTPSEQLYFSEFRGKLGLSAIFKFEFNANLDSTVFLKLKTPKKEMSFLSKPAFLLDSAGGLSMNSLPSYQTTRETILSIPFYLDIVQKCRNYFSQNYKESLIIGYRNTPIAGINIKPKETVTEDDINKINSILRYMGPEAELWFFANMKKNIDMTSTIVNLIFYIVCTIVLIFCLFNLTASMTINIFEQKKEIAIFRTLGTKKSHTIFIYIAEAFILILSSAIIGTIIGSIISYTMALQWAFFTNVNVNFNLPVGNIILIFVFSIFGGILSTLFPARNMLKNTISQLIKSS